MIPRLIVLDRTDTDRPAYQASLCTDKYAAQNTEIDIIFTMTTNQVVSKDKKQRRKNLKFRKPENFPSLMVAKPTNAILLEPTTKTKVSVWISMVFANPTKKGTLWGDRTENAPF